MTYRLPVVERHAAGRARGPYRHRWDAGTLGAARRTPHGKGGLLLFVALTFASSWLLAWLLRDAWRAEEEPVATRLFTTSLAYVVCMGWQPMIAAWIVRRWVDDMDDLDDGLRPARLRFTLYAACGAVGLSSLAAALAQVTGLLGAPMGDALHGNVETEVLLRAPSAALAVALALAASLLLLWLQAFSEELGWRGYFLVALMKRIGPWRGLFLHGAVWGLWYAPIVSLANGWLTRSALRGGAFVVTCTLLGALLAWLRLASRSIVPVVVANATITLAAGLPYMLHGLDAGPRSAVYGPIGWLLMILLGASLGASRWRFVVHVPYGTPTVEHQVRLVWWLASHRAQYTDPGRDRRLN